jgi:selenide,water dikinase
LFELLSGAVTAFRELGVTLTGGHTTEGPELALGFSVTGFGEEDRLFRKGNLFPGDVLMLTRPLGSGALLAAWMRGECRAEWFEPMLKTMLRSNRDAAEIFRDAGVTACTDITGFGLAGHLLEMLDAAGMNARIDAARVPVYPGFDDVVDRGIFSTLHADNAKVGRRVLGKSPAWLFDPQTSGGLLAAISPEKLNSVIVLLTQAGITAAPIATILGPSSDPTLEVA